MNKIIFLACAILCYAINSDGLIAQLIGKPDAKKSDFLLKSAFAQTIVHDGTFKKNPLTELIANQLKTGNSECPIDDRVTFEACLLFQGALGVWHKLGMPEECPIVSQTPSPPEQKVLPRLTSKKVYGALKSPCFGYLYAISVSNAVPILVSTANRTFQMEVSNAYTKIGSDPEICLVARHGICGNHSSVGVALLERGGFQVRPIEFYYVLNGKRQNHVTPEVFIGGKWRLIDTTYGGYWLSKSYGLPFQILSTDELLLGNSAQLFYNTALLPYAAYSEIIETNYFAYLKAKSNVVRGGNGEISILLSGESGDENFLHIPNYLGDTVADKNTSALTFGLRGKDLTYRIQINIASAAFSESQTSEICINETCKKYSSEQKTYEFIVHSPRTLYLKSNMDVAYISMKSLEWKVM